MKRSIYILTIIIFATIHIYAQHAGTISTPKGNSIEYYNGYVGDTAAYRAYADSLIDSNNWDATMVAPGTHEYNCHGFAWHTSEGGSQSDRWINGWKDGDVDYSDQSEIPTNTPTNIVQYWTNNGGYHSIPNKIAKAKVFYGSYWMWENTIYGYRWVNKKDHSAIVDSNTDYFISKWGALPRYRHKPADCPYTEYGLTLSYYYIDKPIISGNFSAICNGSQRTFSESAFTDIDLDYDWSVSNYLDEVSGDGTPSYTVEGTSNIGYATISLTVTTPSGATSSNHDYVGVNTPYPGNLSLSLYTTNGIPVSYMCQETHYHIYLNNDDGCSLSNYTWSIPAGWTENYTWNNMVSVYTGSTPGGMVEVYANTCCGINTKVFIDYLPSGYCGSSYSMILSPNPATGETTLSIETTSEDTEFDENAEWELEVYSESQLLKEKKTNLKGNNAKIQTTGWKEGVYAIRVKYNDEILTGKLVVKK